MNLSVVKSKTEVREEKTVKATKAIVKNYIYNQILIVK